MDKLEAIKTKLLPEQIAVLNKYYKKALENKKQSFFWEQINDDLAPDYAILKSLDVLGFVKIETEKESRGTIYTSYFLTLFPSTIDRMEYENSSDFQKRKTIFFLKYKDWMAVWGFFISLALAIIKFIEYFSSN